MYFGELLAKYIREQKISVNALAQELGLNRGSLYKIFTSAQSLSVELLPVVLNRLSLTVFQEKELTDAFFSEQFGADAYRSVLRFLDKWQRFDEDCVASPSPDIFDIGKFTMEGTLENPAVIRSAVSFVIDSQPETVMTNFPARDVLLHQLLLYAVRQKKIQRLRRIVNFHDEDTVDMFFQIIHLLYQYALATEGTDRENEVCGVLYETAADAGLLYPYFFVSERYAVLFGRDSGIFLSDAEQARQVFARAEDAVQASVKLTVTRNDVMAVSDNYGATLNGVVSNVAFNKTVPIFVDFSKEMFNDLAREDLPNRQYYIDFASEYYRNLLSHWSINGFMSLAGLDDFCATGHTCWMPESYAKNLSMPRRVIYLEKLLAQIREGHVWFLDQRRLRLPANVNLELFGDKLSVYAINPARAFPSFYDLFTLTLDGNSINSTLRLAVEYLKNAGAALSNEAALAEVKKRLSGLRALMRQEDSPLA